MKPLPLLIHLFPVAAGAATYRGMPVEDVLEAMRAGGLEFLYSSDLIKPWMRVEVEPSGRASDISLAYSPVMRKRM